MKSGTQNISPANAKSSFQAKKGDRKIKVRFSKVRQNRRSSSTRRRSSESGAITETTLKLFVSLLVGLVATISLGRLLPYHFAQAGKLKQLRAQVKETKYRVEKKRQQLQKNFDSQQIEALMEEHSPRIKKNRVRVIWQNPASETDNSSEAED